MVARLPEICSTLSHKTEELLTKEQKHCLRIRIPKQGVSAGDAATTNACYSREMSGNLCFMPRHELVTRKTMTRLQLASGIYTNRVEETEKKKTDKIITNCDKCCAGNKVSATENNRRASLKTVVEKLS